MSKLENVTVGADPEVFVADMSGKISSVIGHLGGNKSYPRPVNNGAVQEDNVLAEFNIDPAYSKLEFTSNMTTVMSQLKNILENKGLHTVVVPSHNYTIEELESYGPEAMEFGCSAEFNAWTDREMPRPQGDKVTLRTAGGHVHVGYDSPNPVMNRNLIKMMDFTLGLPSILLDSDAQRRKLYGKAGSMRHKMYGVEYRTLSNFWLQSTELMEWVYDRTLWATSNIDLLSSYLEEVDQRTLCKIINKSDTKSATSVINNLNLSVL
jgi:hypothetical protein